MALGNSKAHEFLKQDHRQKQRQKASKKNRERRRRRRHAEKDGLDSIIDDVDVDVCEDPTYHRDSYCGNPQWEPPIPGFGIVPGARHAETSRTNLEHHYRQEIPESSGSGANASVSRISRRKEQNARSQQDPRYPSSTPETSRAPASIPGKAIRNRNTSYTRGDLNHLGRPPWEQDPQFRDVLHRGGQAEVSNARTNSQKTPKFPVHDTPETSSVANASTSWTRSQELSISADQQSKLGRFGPPILHASSNQWKDQSVHRKSSWGRCSVTSSKPQTTIKKPISSSDDLCLSESLQKKSDYLEISGGPISERKKRRNIDEGRIKKNGSDGKNPVTGVQNAMLGSNEIRTTENTLKCFDH